MFLVEMVGCGIVAPSFVVSFSHAEPDIEGTGEVVCKVLLYREALEQEFGKYLKGRPLSAISSN